MATFNYTVDTRPLATEIGSVSQNVKQAATAVSAMQTAVVMAEEKAADYVCEHVNQGFYALIRSQISQKLAKFQSEVDAHLLQLEQQKNALISVKDRMQRDYNMISRRYIRLFNDLNKSLKQSIYELDKPTILFAVKESDKLFNRSKYLAATVPMSQSESLGESQKILASNLKCRGLNVIKSIKGFLFDMKNQKSVTDRILIHDENHTESKTILVPVVICECNRDKSGNKNVEITLSDMELDNLSKATIMNAVYAAFPQMEWEHRAIFDPRIKEEFRKYVASSSSPQKVKDMTMKLFLSGNYNTI
ncbi:hypothetical protein FACS189411_02440 [Bacteroidia bacterium]|nr:hypothetical protein FACS189411_02440 [Bacteroidia bacterium]